MKKISTIAKMALSLLFGGLTMSATAQNVIQEGVAIALEQDVVYEFTPSMTGTLTVKVNSYPYFVWTGNGSFLYSGKECDFTQIIQKSSYTSPADESYTDYIFKPIEKGVTYYVKQSNYKGNVDFTFTMSESATSETLTSVVPSTDNIFNYVQNPEIQISASAGITSVGKVTISYGTTSLVLDPETYGVFPNGPAGSEWLQIGGSSFAPFKELMYEIAGSGATSFTVTVEDMLAGGLPVTASTVNQKSVTINDGVISVTYPIEKTPVYLPKESVWPSKFYSYWAPNDPAALIKLAFDMNIKSVGEAKVVMGMITPGGITEDTFDEYDLTPYISVSGSTVTINLAGVERVGNQKTVTIMVTNVVGTNGMPVEMNEYGTTLTLFEYLSYSSDPAPENPNTPEQPEPEEPTYMSGSATLVNMEISETDTALELTWPETVTIVDADEIEIPVYLGTELLGNLSSIYLNLVGGGASEPGVATRAETGDSGTVMFVLLGAAEILEGPGEYTVVIPEGMVENADGAVNKEQTFKVTYVEGAMGVVSPESGTTFELGENVVITISFDGVVEENYSPDAPVIVTDNAEYDEQLTWTPNVLYIEGNDIVINLGNELEEGTYYLSLREGVVVVDGVNNAPIFDYVFMVGESGTGAVNTIGADNGVNEIYNLNGVKVNENNLKSGVYIINGKKVVVRK